MPSTALTQPKPGSKQALLLQRLEGAGATITDLTNVTGWQPHTVRAAITGLRKRGFSIERVEKAGDEKSRYSLKTANSSSRKRRSK